MKAYEIGRRRAVRICDESTRRERRPASNAILCQSPLIIASFLKRNLPRISERGVRGVTNDSIIVRRTPRGGLHLPLPQEISAYWSSIVCTGTRPYSAPSGSHSVRGPACYRRSDAAAAAALAAAADWWPLRGCPSSNCGVAAA